MGLLGGYSYKSISLRSTPRVNDREGRFLIYESILCRSYSINLMSDLAAMVVSANSVESDFFHRLPACYSVLTYNNIIIIFCWSVSTAFPTRALGAAEKGNYYFNRTNRNEYNYYRRGLDFRTHRQKPDGSRARITHTYIYVFHVQQVGRCMHKYIYATCWTPKRQCFRPTQPRPVRVSKTVCGSLRFPFQADIPRNVY